MSDSIFYTVGKTRLGPSSIAELRSLVAKGEFKRTDKVWREGMTDWQPATAIPEIFAGMPPDLDNGSVPRSTTPPLFEGKAPLKPKPQAEQAHNGPQPEPTFKDAQKRARAEVPSSDNPSATRERIKASTIPDQPQPPTSSFNRPYLAVLGIFACIMILFPPVETFHSPLFVEDRGIAWQVWGHGPPDLVVADGGGYRDKHFAFILTLSEQDRIIFPQLLLQSVILIIVGIVMVSIKSRQTRRPTP